MWVSNIFLLTFLANKVKILYILNNLKTFVMQANIAYVEKKILNINKHKNLSTKMQ